MSALSIWFQNHKRNLTQEAIDEALMLYIEHVERQRDLVVEALEAMDVLFSHLARDCTQYVAVDKTREALAALKSGDVQPKIPEDWKSTRKQIYDDLFASGATIIESCCGVPDKGCGEDVWRITTSQIEKVITK